MRHRRTAWWRLVLAGAALLVLLLRGGASLAEDVPVPVSLQAQLLVKVAGYDRNFASRAGERARILLVVQPGNSASSRTATEMQRELASVDTIGGLPHEETVVLYSDAAALRAQCEKDQIAIVFVAPGLADQIEPIRAAFDGLNVISASAVPDYVPKGIVLGFDLVSGKPKLLVHLSQAKRQKVDFSSAVLKLMRVYE